MGSLDVTSPEYFRRLAQGGTHELFLTPEEIWVGGCRVEQIGWRGMVVGPKTDVKALRNMFAQKQEIIIQQQNA